MARRGTALQRFAYSCAAMRGAHRVSSGVLPTAHRRLRQSASLLTDNTDYLSQLISIDARCDTCSASIHSISIITNPMRKSINHTISIYTSDQTYQSYLIFCEALDRSRLISPIQDLLGAPDPNLTNVTSQHQHTQHRHTPLILFLLRLLHHHLLHHQHLLHHLLL